ncbi:conserved protein of unknown function [Xenorhabdus doucetiae]|uniref:Uncharacterized protein n=1 Tax=Xenorhabdus doucetiae TaxID=351671 RepID=A0A068QME0_9GAMM|nr:conserved protein of unknown function [Xenorhabdus doucetiae]
MANETRTRDNWNHNPGLYQLSYSHHNNYLFSHIAIFIAIFLQQRCLPK